MNISGDGKSYRPVDEHAVASLFAGGLCASSRNAMAATSAMPPPGPATIRFQIEQSLAAPVDAVWELWTTRAGLERWWGSEQFVTSVRGLDPRAEGKIEIELRYRPAVEDPRRIRGGWRPHLDHAARGLH
jgi:hypothetical protein